MTETLKHLSEECLFKLLNGIDENVDCYKGGGFRDQAENSGWGLKIKSIKINPELLSQLDTPDGQTKSDAEFKNSLLVYEAIEGMTPNLACEDRIWTRLTHVECFEYSRKRWIPDGADDAGVCKAVKTHFFANTQTKLRDDNAVARLWWNAHIAHSSYPHDPEIALKTILKKADIRSNLVERSGDMSRPSLAAGLIRIMTNEPWVTEKEDHFREFMKTVNKHGGGVLFEIMTDEQADQFMNECFKKACSNFRTARVRVMRNSGKSSKTDTQLENDRKGNKTQH